MMFAQYIAGIVVLLFNMGCQSSLVPASKRGIDGLIRNKEPVGHKRPIGSEDRSQLYIAQDELKIEEVDERSTHGSLFHMDDQRNYLFASAKPLQIGSFVNVKVVAVQAAKEEGAEAAPDQAPEDEDAIVQEMLAMLPQLDAGDKNPKLVGNLEMKVVDRFKNGDLLVAYKRNSMNGDQGREIHTTARLPYAATLRKEPITTKDLVDVAWKDTLDDSLASRSSTHWQDEYSLRLSGFTEAQSQYAANLSARERKLQEARDRVRNEMVSFGVQRRQMAKEREEWVKKMNENNARMVEIEKELAKLQPQEPAEGQVAEAPAEAAPAPLPEAAVPAEEPAP
jgi:hypothetical protein